LLLTTAHTSGPGAACRLQETTSKANAAAARNADFGLKERPLPEGPASSRFLDATGADARSANADLFVSAIDNSLHAAEIRIPAAAAHVVRVADHVAEARLLTADFTSECHDLIAPNDLFLPDL
jgi:hypothetical protein